jgi:hypothetical protein
MSGMEPESKDFLRRILWSFFMGWLWLTINMTLGIYFRLLLFEEGLRLVNLLFYLFLVGSLVCLVWYYRRLWKKKFPHG